MSSGSRLPSVLPLTSCIPTGTEGGKEFGRIIGLLLLNDAKIRGIEFVLFDDASGDFEGLDSYSRNPKAKHATGYQYKYFPSPLSDNHRHEIVAAVANAARRTKRLKLQKWVLVTPDDFINSGRREGGGDVEWFENLRNKYKSKFEIEHLGHTKLVSLFMQAPHLCLFYYPNLVSNGATKRKSIQELRGLYDQHMRRRHGRIEFVGMSVYKDETSRRVPLEDIYIPLSILPERSPEENDSTPRVDPATLLAPGSRSVILGDPGSGKSTLLAFLALVGISEKLQRRCKRDHDGRLTIFVTLRRYADELKENLNLSLLEHILSVAKADFNISALNLEFYEFYLESGQAVILFDGLDELPGVKFKSIIRKRIESFTTSYPNNTIIVTSRLVGYEAEVRFGDSYSHYRVAKLRPHEIEKFILDWYKARIEDPEEGRRNASDLIRVITHTDSESIRDLARNPLLLTIVTLVHRIDAVLPDQRVILYQKCTETLLNTWYKAKRTEDEPIKGRIERRNRLRIEAIAYWMQRKSLGEQGRSVVPHADIITFLTKYISDVERPKENEDPAEDQAEVFLDFIKNAAGLLIEAGDGLYSFIHLTFQEYLCATHLSAFGEVEGAQSIWNELGGDLQHPRWREVVRLLVASLKSIQGQTFFIEKLVSGNNVSPSRDAVLLLVGLLKDGIEPAEERAAAIVHQTLQCLLICKSSNDVRIIESALRAWVDKDVNFKGIATAVHDELFASSKAEEKLALALIRAGVDLTEHSPEQKLSISEGETSGAFILLNDLVFEPAAPIVDARISEALFVLHMIWSRQSPETNVSGVGLLAVSMLTNSERASRILFDSELGLLHSVGLGPYQDHGLNLLAIALPDINELHPALSRALKNAITRGSDRSRHEEMRNVFRSAYVHRLKSIGSGMPDEREDLVDHSKSYWQHRARKLQLAPRIFQLHVSPKTSDDVSELSLIRRTFMEEKASKPASYWDLFTGSEMFNRFFIKGFEACAQLKSISYWAEALRITLASRVAETFGCFLEVAEWDRLVKSAKEGALREEDLDVVAWLLMFDIWIWNNNGYENPVDSPLGALAESVSHLTYAPIEVALITRAAAHGTPGARERLLSLMEEKETNVSKVLDLVGWPSQSDVPAVIDRKISKKKR